MQRGDDLDISAELVDARDNSHIWGQRYSRKLADVFALQDDVAKEMTTALRMRLTGDEEKRMAKNYTTNPEAYQLYLQGRYWWNKRSEEGFNRGLEYFQQAIAKDPSYALAYSGLADCYSLLAAYSFLPPKEAFPKAKDAAQKALEIDSTLAEAYASRGYIKFVYELDWSGADREFQQAIKLNPSYATAHQWRADALVNAGRLDEARAEEKRALELDPLSVIINWESAHGFYFSRQYDQAIEQERKTLEMDPNFVAAHAELCRAYVPKSMYKESIAECEKSVAISPGNALTLSLLGYAYAAGGAKSRGAKGAGPVERDFEAEVHASGLPGHSVYGSWREGQSLRVARKGL